MKGVAGGRSQLRWRSLVFLADHLHLVLHLLLLLLQVYVTLPTTWRWWYVPPRWWVFGTCSV